MYKHLFYMYLKFLFFIYFKISLLHISEITSFRPACCTTQFVSDHSRNPKDSFLMAHMSGVKRKPAFCTHENKDADQLPVIHYSNSTSLFFINPKFQASRHILWLYSPVCVRPGQKPRRPGFSQRAHIVGDTFYNMLRVCSILP